MKSACLHPPPPICSVNIRSVVFSFRNISHHAVHVLSLPSEAACPSGLWGASVIKSQRRVRTHEVQQILRAEWLPRSRCLYPFCLLCDDCFSGSVLLERGWISFISRPFTVVPLVHCTLFCCRQYLDVVGRKSFKKNAFFFYHELPNYANISTASPYQKCVPDLR